MFTKLRIESVFISFVSFSFNKPHVSVPTRTCIRVTGEIRVPNKNIRFIRVVRVQKTVSVATRTKIREIGEIRVPNKFAFYSLVRDPKTVSATPRTNIRESAIRVQKNIRDIRFIRVQNIS